MDFGHMIQTLLHRRRLCILPSDYLTLLAPPRGLFVSSIVGTRVLYTLYHRKADSMVAKIEVEIEAYKLWFAYRAHYKSSLRTTCGNLART